MDPRNRKIVTIIGIALGCVLAAGVIGIAVLRQEPHASGVDTKLKGVKQPTTVRAPKAAAVPVVAQPAQRCSLTYGGSPERRSDYSDVPLGRPTRPIWQVRTGALVEFPPSLCDGTLYANNADGFTYAIDAKHGRVIWRRKTGSTFDSTPAIAARSIVIGGVDGNITALDRSNGTVLWKLRMSGPVETSPVIVAGERTVIAASLDGRLLSIDLARGTINWAYQTGGDIKGSPVVVGNTVYTANYAGEVVAVDLNTGKLKWRQAYRLDPVRTERIYSSTPHANGMIVFGTVGGYVYALNAQTGAQRWKRAVGTYVYSTPAIANGTVFVGDFAGRVHAYTLSNGRDVWSGSMPGPVSGSPVVIGHLVYVSTIKGSTSAFDVRTGRKVWSIARGKYVPGIADNSRIYFALNGLITAYAAHPK